MKIPEHIAFLAVTVLAGSALHGAVTSPYTEDFSSGSEGLNMTPVSGTLIFNNFIYSVDGSGGVALFDVVPFLAPTDMDNFSGLGVIGDWQWSGTTTHGVHTFTMASSDSTTFSLDALDWATGNGGPPTEYTITGFRGASQVAQIASIDISAGGTYGPGTGSEIVATDIGPGDDTAYGLNLVFSGEEWGNIDRIVFSATGNDIMVAMDNIQLSPAVPEPSAAALLIGAGVLGLGVRRRSRLG